MGYELVAGDSGAELIVSLVDKTTGGALDLSGKTITLKYSLANASVQTRPMTIVEPPESGQCRYVWQAADLTTHGNIEAEVYVNDAQTGLTTVEAFQLNVRRRVGG